MKENLQELNPRINRRIHSYVAAPFIVPILYRRVQFF